MRGMATSRTPPYWLEGGTERCFACEGFYVLQMEFRCVGCDRGLCEQCIVLVWPLREVYCKECHESLREAG